MPNSALISAIQNSTSLGAVLLSLDHYIEKLPAEKFSDEDSLAQLIEEEIGEDFLNLQDRERFYFANKLQNVFIYLMQTSRQLQEEQEALKPYASDNLAKMNHIQENLTSINRKLMIVNTLIPQCSKSMTDTPYMANKLDSYLDDIYEISTDLYSHERFSVFSMDFVVVLWKIFLFPQTWLSSCGKF